MEKDKHEVDDLPDEPEDRTEPGTGDDDGADDAVPADEEA